MKKPKQHLTAYRVKRGLSQEALAKEVGLKGKSSISEIETGERTASVRVALEIEKWSGGVVSAASLNPLLKRAARQAAA